MGGRRASGWADVRAAGGRVTDGRNDGQFNYNFKEFDNMMFEIHDSNNKKAKIFGATPFQLPC